MSNREKIKVEVWTREEIEEMHREGARLFARFCPEAASDPCANAGSCSARTGGRKGSPTVDRPQEAESQSAPAYIENEREYLDYLRVRCGMPRIGYPGPSALSYDMLQLTEWSPALEQCMRNRLIIGAMRYGVLHDRRKPAWDRITRAVAELQLFLQDRNKERLVDAANMCLLAFEEGYGHFEATDDTGLHTGVITSR